MLDYLQSLADKMWELARRTHEFFSGASIPARIVAAAITTLLIGVADGWTVRGLVIAFVMTVVVLVGLRPIVNGVAASATRLSTVLNSEFGPYALVALAILGYVVLVFV